MSRLITTRRSTLKLLGASAATVGIPNVSYASVATDRRLVMVILRGGLDGLSVVVPHGDPDYARLRPNIALPLPGNGGGALPLNDKFSLHPNLRPIHPLWNDGQLLAVHAVGTPDRSRSHFDAQDTLENGTDRARGARDGWLNRTVQVLGGKSGLGLAVGRSVPLLMRGPATVRTWAPKGLPEAGPSFLKNVARLYEQDPLFKETLAASRRSAAAAARAMSKAKVTPLRPNREFQVMCEAAGQLLGADDGPRIASLELGGWDTHVNQDFAIRRPLSELADGLVAMKTQLGSAWHKTAIIVVSEFGRTARENGGRGTDHGTAGVILLLGGAVRGRRILGAWPGMSDEALFERRDLRPTTDLRAVIKGTLAQHFGIERSRLDDTVFPRSSDLEPMRNLVVQS